MFGLGDVWGFILAPEELFRPCCQDNDSLIFLGQQTRLAVFYLLFFFFLPPGCRYCDIGSVIGVLEEGGPFGFKTFGGVMMN